MVPFCIRLQGHTIWITGWTFEGTWYGFGHFAVVRNSPFSKTSTIRSFHTGCKLVNFVVAAVRPVVSSAFCWRKWWSTSVEEPREALDGEATDLTKRVYNGFFFSQKKRMGIDSFNSDCFRETTCRLIYGIYIEFIMFTVFFLMVGVALIVMSDGYLLSLTWIPLSIPTKAWLVINIHELLAQNGSENSTTPKKVSCLLKRGHFKRKGLSSYYYFSRDNVSFWVQFFLLIPLNLNFQYKVEGNSLTFQGKNSFNKPCGFGRSTLWMRG